MQGRGGAAPGAEDGGGRASSPAAWRTISTTCSPSIIGGLDTIRRAESRRDTARGSSARCRHGAAGRPARGQPDQRACWPSRGGSRWSRKPLDAQRAGARHDRAAAPDAGRAVELEGRAGAAAVAVEADQNQLESAMLNLAVNARDAMPDGGKLTIETANTPRRVLRRAATPEVIPGQYVMICASATPAPACRRRSLERVFEPFFTTKEVGPRNGPRPQHGLWLREAVRRTRHDLQRGRPGHDGEAVSSRAIRRRHCERRRAARCAMVRRSSDGEVILVVEDNEDVRAYSA